MKIFLPILLAAVALTAARAVDAECRVIDGSAPKGTGGAGGITEQQAQSLFDVFQRLGTAAGGTPPLYVCRAETVNAMAYSDPQGRIAIVVYSKLVNAFGSDNDAMAAVLGHELGHLIHTHAQQTREILRGEIAKGGAEWRQRVANGMDAQAAARIVLTNARKNVSEFKKIEEREADDTGFSLSVKAGFDPAGAQRVFKRLIAEGGNLYAAYFDVHPGLVERIEYSSRLITNEEFRKKAERQAAQKQVGELGKTVGEWRSKMPDSGAAAYYAAVYSIVKGAGWEDVSAALEDAVSNFDGEGLSKEAQSYQSEGSSAALDLCVALYREGRKIQSLNCLQKLSDPQIEQFRTITGWNDFFFVRSRAGNQGAPLYGGRDDNDIVLTNCDPVARGNGLKVVQPWKGLRGTSSDPDKPLPKNCARDLCHCTDAD